MHWFPLARLQYGAALTRGGVCSVVAAGEGPLCRFNIVSPDGRLSRDHPVPISRAQMMHDFAICKSYAVFLDSAVVFEPTRMVTKPAAGMPFRNDLATPSRILLVSRADPSQVLAFEVDPFAFFHTANAWEEGTPGEADHVVHVALCRCATITIPSFVILVLEVAVGAQAGGVGEG